MPEASLPAVGDLLDEIGCRNDALRQRNAVIWAEKDDLEPVFDAAVSTVDAFLTDGVDRLDDALGHVVARSAALASGKRIPAG